MTAEAAGHIGKLLALEQRGRGDLQGAIDRVARRAGVSRWTIEHIRKGRAKGVSEAVKQAIRSAYLSVLERQVAAILAEIDAVKALGGNADALSGIEAEAEALVARFNDAKAAALSRAGGR